MISPLAALFGLEPFERSGIKSEALRTINDLRERRDGANLDEVYGWGDIMSHPEVLMPANLLSVFDRRQLAHSPVLELHNGGWTAYQETPARAQTICNAIGAFTTANKNKNTLILN